MHRIFQTFIGQLSATGDESNLRAAAVDAAAVLGLHCFAYLSTRRPPHSAVRLKICCPQGRVGSSLTGAQSPRGVTCYASQHSARWWSQPQRSDSAGRNRAVPAHRPRRDRGGLRRPQNGKPNIIRELEPFSEPELLTEVLVQPAKSSKPSNRLNANRECMYTSP
jgi:hypothetical protein